MSRLERTAERRVFEVGPLKRISWGAIFGGSVLSIAIITILGVLGVAVGAMSMDSSMGDISPRTMGIAAGLWWVISGMLAVFVGAMVASRLAGFGRRWEGPLHGIISWALTTLAAFALTTSVIVGMQQDRGPRHRPGMATPMASGEFGVVVLAAQSNVPEEVWRDVQREARDILRRSARHTAIKPMTKESTEMAKPDSNEMAKPESTEMAKPDSNEMAKSSPDMMSEAFSKASDELEEAVAGLYRGAKTMMSEKDKATLIEILVHRTELDRAAAEQQVDQWAKQLNDAWFTARRGLAEASRDMRETRLRASAGAPQAVSSAAWFTFFYLLLSAIAAGIGGKVGAPNHRFRHMRAPEAPKTVVDVEEEEEEE